MDERKQLMTMLSILDLNSVNAMFLTDDIVTLHILTGENRVKLRQKILKQKIKEKTIRYWATKFLSNDEIPITMEQVDNLEKYHIVLILQKLMQIELD